MQRWAGRQPSASGSTSTERRCMAALIRGVGNDTKAGDWVDQNCNTSMYYICQRGVYNIILEKWFKTFVMLPINSIVNF